VHEIVEASKVYKLKLWPDGKHLLKVDQSHTIKDLFHVFALSENVWSITMFVEINEINVSTSSEFLLIRLNLWWLIVKRDADIFTFILADAVLVNARVAINICRCAQIIFYLKFFIYLGAHQIEIIEFRPGICLSLELAAVIVDHVINNLTLIQSVVVNKLLSHWARLFTCSFIVLIYPKHSLDNEGNICLVYDHVGCYCFFIKFWIVGS